MQDSVLSLHSATPDAHSQWMLSIGIVVVALLDGVLLTLGLICMLLLSPRSQPRSPQNKYLRIYVVVLLLSNFGYEVGFFIWNNLPYIFWGASSEKRSGISNILALVGKLTPTVLIGLTDGLLVWRCYKVHKVLGPNETSIWKLCWFIPLCLCFITAVTCIVGGVLTEFTRLSVPASRIQATGYVSNVFLNVFATAYICNRLMHHRRLVKTYFGPSASTQRHVRIMSILLESAAINVPITVAGAVGIGRAELFGLIVVTVAITSQSLASLLVILLIALGRAIEQTDGLETERTGQSRTEALDLTIPATESGHQIP